MDEDVQLPVPQIRTRFFPASPIYVAAKTVHQVHPRGGAFGTRMIWIRVNPMLKRVHGRNPRKHADDAFEMDAARALRVGGGIKFLDELVAEQFHAHGSD